MKPSSIAVIPAYPGFLTVLAFEDEREVATGDPVIAWRIQTYATEGEEESFSSCHPLTVDGDAVQNCIGIQNPDMTVTVFQSASYKSLAELQNERYPNP